MATRGYYVRLGGQTIGPMSAAELKDLARRGGLKPDTPLSADGVRWAAASGVRGLAVATSAIAPAASNERQGPAVPPPPPAVRDSAGPRHPASVWLVLGLAGCGICGTLFVVLAVLAFAGGPSVGSRAERSAADRTLAYWNGMIAACQSEQIDAGPQSQQAAASGRIAARLRALPAAGVDPQAVACATELADMLETFRGFAVRYDGPSIMIESFFRGAAGDPYGTARDVFAAQGDLFRRASEVQKRVGTTRAALSVRYGVEFRAL